MDIQINSDRRSLHPYVERILTIIYFFIIFLSISVVIAPIIVVVGISFNPGVVEAFPPEGLSLRWYIEFLNNGRFMTAFFLVSMPIAFATAFIATTLGVLAAYTLSMMKFRFQNGIQALMITPIMIPGAVVGLSLMFLFISLDLRGTFLNVIIGHSVRVMPFTFLIALASLSKVDFDLEHAARDLGASKTQAFLQVTLPLIKSAVIAGFLLSFILSFADINIALFLGRGENTTLPVEMYGYLLFQRSPIIAAIGTIKILLILTLLVVIGRLVGFERVYQR